MFFFLIAHSAFTINWSLHDVPLIAKRIIIIIIIIIIMSTFSFILNCMNNVAQFYIHITVHRNSFLYK